MNKRSLLLVALLFFAPLSNATVIDATGFNVAGDRWQFDYVVDNDTLGFDIEEFTIWFDLGLFDNLDVVASPADWDSIAINPDGSIPDDGFFDSLALAAGIAPGDILGGFSVQFDWLGDGSPISQFWEIIDPFTFDVLDEGETNVTIVRVPEPATLALLLAALGLLALSRRGSTLRFAAR